MGPAPKRRTAAVVEASVDRTGAESSAMPKYAGNGPKMRPAREAEGNRAAEAQNGRHDPIAIPKHLVLQDGFVPVRQQLELRAVVSRPTCLNSNVNLILSEAPILFQISDGGEVPRCLKVPLLRSPSQNAISPRPAWPKEFMRQPETIVRVTKALQKIDVSPLVGNSLSTLLSGHVDDVSSTISFT